ncbi:hypothetical protein Cob_v012133 [Colletotrichum orbiculare MAFF 240422]|uniref:Uncharacterized protein n=1 Tax=Colletotrichum orbiculare (strain 104-T / ATCC 96160 / CBS 514.97 / LARS 414 / MAFF 240422) TaxID=1213857 RepID=A0A484FBY9_COLOR|nr:hypothetical protein Cob_v012133 [Colletotrichum orbiculare MAFF 240422]
MLNVFLLFPPLRDIHRWASHVVWQAIIIDPKECERRRAWQRKPMAKEQSLITASVGTKKGQRLLGITSGRHGRAVWIATSVCVWRTRMRKPRPLIPMVGTTTKSKG